MSLPVVPTNLKRRLEFSTLLDSFRRYSPCSIISSLTPSLLLLEFAELLLFLLDPEAFAELGEDVDAAAWLEPDELFALLLLELLPLLPELEEDSPEDCFSFLALIIIYTIVWSII